MKNIFNTVWLIDDNHIDNYINKTMILISQFSKNIIDFESAQKAQEYLDDVILNVKKQVVPDLLFLDINIPQMNGFEFLKANEIKLLQLNPNFKTIFLTSSLSEDDKRKASHFQTFYRYISKPLDLGILESLHVNPGK